MANELANKGREVFSQLNERLKKEGCTLGDTRGNGFRLSEALVKNGTNLQTASVEEAVNVLYGFIRSKVNAIINQGESNDLEWAQTPPALVKHRRQRGNEMVHSANRGLRQEPIEERKKEPITREAKQMLEEIYDSIEILSPRHGFVRRYLDDLYETGGDANHAAARIKEFLKIEPLSAAERYLWSGQGAEVRDFIFSL